MTIAYLLVASLAAPLPDGAVCFQCDVVLVDGRSRRTAFDVTYVRADSDTLTTGRDG